MKKPSEIPSHTGNTGRRNRKKGGADKGVDGVIKCNFTMSGVGTVTKGVDTMTKGWEQ